MSRSSNSHTLDLARVQTEGPHQALAQLDRCFVSAGTGNSWGHWCLSPAHLTKGGRPVPRDLPPCPSHFLQGP